MSASDQESAQVLALLRKVEALGGSAGYQQNPSAWSEVVAELDPGDEAQHIGATQQERVTSILQGLESLGGSTGYEQSLTLPTSPGGILFPSIPANRWSGCTATLTYTWAVNYNHVRIDSSDGSGGGFLWSKSHGRPHGMPRRVESFSILLHAPELKEADTIYWSEIAGQTVIIFARAGSPLRLPTILTISQRPPPIPTGSTSEEVLGTLTTIRDVTEREDKITADQFRRGSFTWDSKSDS